MRNDNVSDDDQGAARKPKDEPHWLIRDGLLALVIGSVLVGAQFYLDGRLSEREQAIEAERSKRDERLENLRYVRDRADAQANADDHKAFNNLDLTGMNFTGLDLSRGIFWGAVLDKADFTTARMYNSAFGYGAMTEGGGTADGTIFRGTRLEESQFTSWDGDGAIFENAYLVDA